MFQRKFISFFILLGLFFMPKQMFACGLKSSSVDKSHCEISISKSTHKDHCNSCGSKKCPGKCKNPFCKCPTSNPSPTVLNQENFNFFKLKEFNTSSFSSYETPVSKGFHSIWLIPKIG